jgi:hypothetical protein
MPKKATIKPLLRAVVTAGNHPISAILFSKIQVFVAAIYQAVDIVIWL